MIGEVREKDQNKICTNNRKHDARFAHGLTILQVTERIYSLRTEDANKKIRRQGLRALHWFLAKGAVVKLNRSRL